MNPPLLVLASNSPRRRELLSLGGWPFESQAADVDESQRPGEPQSEYVLRLAERKARACAESHPAGQVILAADTTVADGDAILGKPAGPSDAAGMLRRLRGHTHQVLTGLALLRLADGRLVTDLCITDVPMRLYSDEEIEAYIASGDPLDKAGAYAIQHAVFQPVEGLQGCFASVMGLPLCHLARSLNKLGLAANPDIARACQRSLQYDCSISSAVLRGEAVG